MKMHSTIIENGSVRLKLDWGWDIELNKIVLKPSLFDFLNSRFTGNISFEFMTDLIRSDASFWFSYDRRAETSCITDFVCRNLFLSADETIRFLDSGKVEVGYTANNEKGEPCKHILSFTGYPAKLKNPAGTAEEK
jgi:hypothetical protein